MATGLHRRIDWSSAMRDLRNDRRPANPGFLAARSLEIARLDRLSREANDAALVVAGSFDRSAIMKAAAAQARLQKAKGSKLAWAALMASALRFVWLRAKAARAALAH